MALQPYSGDSAKALALVPEISEEERRRREVEADALDERLRYIVEELPDRTYTVAGSTAGAGSSDFHTYRSARRREQERLARMDEHFQAKTLAEEDKRRREMLAAEDEERTAKKRAKRMKKKEKAAAAKREKGGEGGGGGEGTGASAGSELAAGLRRVGGGGVGRPPASPKADGGSPDRPPAAADLD